ncbi:hypothetical protein ACFTQ8_17535, partial [Heyndrickxia sporothermodurans]|uniref:hypothetical protein n=1 Tax=Heyndrickxia sporothermodurans TaxID=46224 RepID=UPI0036395E99
ILRFRGVAIFLLKNPSIKVVYSLFYIKVLTIRYFIKGLPYEMISVGDIISGGIGKKKGEWIWTWILTQSVFPPRAKKFFSQVMITM